jgi:signal peptidase I
MFTKILKIIFSTLIFLLIPIVLFLLITSRSSILFGIRSYDVLTGSMEPTIHVGSMIFSRPSASYQKGDIITFNRGNITVTHRIFSVDKGSFRTKGDANNAVDPQIVYPGSIIGKDVVIIPNFGKFTSFFKTIPGFIIFIALPILIFIGFETRTFKKEWEKEVEKKLLRKLEGAKEA